ncbi:ATP-grasp domain-containing protein [Paenibacillus mendelii]|uniref:RimK family alpha-L-glutamate ligase n=1 Tax=Paenibacillus mendelii TaxID=206163 RepID=A0ABV6JLQ4_9BACL|nr:ATP-grasp domain-containing protein [Paenibacillus mendelii]
MTNNPKIGIIGARNERHCIYLADELRQQGAEPLIMDNTLLQPFPLTLWPGKNSYHTHEREHSLEEMHAFYLRALFLPTPAFDARAVEAQIREEGYVAYAAQRERYATWLSWLKCLPLQDKLLVNPVDTLLLHFAKPYQLEMLRQASIPVPDTLVTGNGAHVRAFANRRSIVYKPVAGGAHCQQLTEQDLQPERLEALAQAPVLFQEFVEGQDIRVFVLDSQVIAAFEIESEGIDYRTGSAKVTPVSITDELSDLCIRACKTLGLVFSGVDLKQRSDGSVILIECNPSPMFEGFDRHAHIPIVSQLARFLIHEARSRLAQNTAAGLS